MGTRLLYPNSAADRDTTRYPYSLLKMGKAHKIPCLIPISVEYLRFNWMEHLLHTYPIIKTNPKKTIG